MQPEPAEAATPQAQAPPAEPQTNEPLTDIEVQLSGEDGNSFFILGRVRAALRHGRRSDLIEPFTIEATSGDYDHLLATVAAYVHVS